MSAPTPMRSVSERIIPSRECLRRKVTFPRGLRKLRSHDVREESEFGSSTFQTLAFKQRDRDSSPARSYRGPSWPIFMLSTRCSEAYDAHDHSRLVWDMIHDYIFQAALDLLRPAVRPFGAETSTVLGRRVLWPREMDLNFCPVSTAGD